MLRWQIEQCIYKQLKFLAMLNMTYLGILQAHVLRLLFLMMLWVDRNVWLWFFLIIFTGILHVKLLNEIPISSMQYLTSYSKKR